MSSLPLKRPATGPSKHMHRLLQRRTNEASTPAFSSSTVPPFSTVSSLSSTLASTLTSSTPPQFGTVSSLSSTPASTLTSSTPQQFGTVSAPSSTYASTPTSSTTPLFGTVLAPIHSTVSASTPSSTPATSSDPSSTTAAPGASVVTEQEDTRLDGRLRITVEAKELVHSGKCAQIIKKSFLDKVDPKGYKWANISEEIKEFYWEEFQKKCTWDVAIGDSVKTAWKHQAKETYRRYIYNMSSRNSTREKPCQIEDEVWTAWNAVWNSEEFKKKSDQNKKNRRKGVAGGKAPPTHNGGSASHKKIATDMEKYMGKPPSVYDVFMFTHTKDHDGKTLIDEKSKKVHDFYMSRRADLELIGEDVDDSELFYTAIGGHDRKKRIYGLGSYGRSIFSGNSSETCTSQNTNLEKDHLETKIQKMEYDLNDMRSIVDDLKSRINN